MNVLLGLAVFFAIVISPAIPAIILSVVLSILGAIFGFEPPKHKPGQPGWFKHRDW